MMSRRQVDALVEARTAYDAAAAKLYARPAPEHRVSEYVPSLGQLREIAAAVGKSPYKMDSAGIGMEAVDYGPVHFFAHDGRAR